MNNCYPSIPVTLSGRILDRSSEPLSGITILYTVDCVPYTARSDMSGHYSIAAPEGARVIIRPELGLGVVSMPEKYALRACADRSTLDFVIRPLTPAMYTISGALSGLPNVAGLTVTYTVNGQSASVTTDAQGGFRITAPPGSNVIITPPAQSGFTVSPANYVFNNLSGDRTGQDFVYTGATLTVGGAVSGLPNLAGVMIAYIVNGRFFSTSTDAAGNYSFLVAPNDDVIIQPAAQIGFTVSPLSYQIPNIGSNSPDNNFIYTAT